METVKETLNEEIYKILYEFDIVFNDRVKENRFINVLKDIFYIISDNEQLVTINETCKYLDSLSVTDVQKILKEYLNKSVNDGMKQLETNVTMTTRNAQVYNILNYLHEAHFLNMMLTITEKFNDLHVHTKLLIAYYLILFK